MSRVWVEFWSSRGWVRVEFGSSSGCQKRNLIKWMTNLKIFLYSKATNLWQFYALSILLHHSGIVVFDDYPFPPFSAHFFFFSAPMKIYFHLKFFLKDHTARRMTKVLWDSWVISHVSNAREIRQYIGSRCVMCWRLDHYHHQLRIFTLWSFVTDLQQ